MSRKKVSRDQCLKKNRWKERGLQKKTAYYKLENESTKGEAKHHRFNMNLLMIGQFEITNQKWEKDLQIIQRKDLNQKLSHCIGTEIDQ